MANPNIGEIDCEACEKRGAKNTRAYVRRDKNGKLYVLCPRCGKVTRGNPAGQEYLLTYARLYSAERAAEEVERAAAQVAAPAPDPVPETPPPYVAPEKPAPYVATETPAPAPAPKKPAPPPAAPRRGFFADLDL